MSSISETNYFVKPLKRNFSGHINLFGNYLLEYLKFEMDVITIKISPQVSICDINIEVGEELVNVLAAKHGKNRVMFSHCDVTDYSQFEGELLVLINK